MELLIGLAAGTGRASLVARLGRLGLARGLGAVFGGGATTPAPERNIKRKQNVKKICEFY